MKRKQMMISFGVYDDDVYEFLQNNKNASALVRMLVRAYMGGGNASLPTPALIKQDAVATEPKVSEEKIAEPTPKVEKVVETKPKVEKAINKVEKNISSENKNRNKIKELSL